MGVQLRVQFVPWTLDPPTVFRSVLPVSSHELCGVSQCIGRACEREPHRHQFVCEWSRWTYNDLKRQQMSFLCVNLITSLNVLLGRLTNPLSEMLQLMRLKIKKNQGKDNSLWNFSGGRLAHLTREINRAMVKIACLICFIISSAHAFPSVPPQDAIKPLSTATAAETAASSAPVPVVTCPKNALAAAAARQDQDPNLNGSVSDVRQIPPPAN